MCITCFLSLTSSPTSIPFYSSSVLLLLLVQLSVSKWRKESTKMGKEEEEEVKRRFTSKILLPFCKSFLNSFSFFISFFHSSGFYILFFTFSFFLHTLSFFLSSLIPLTVINEAFCPFPLRKWKSRYFFFLLSLYPSFLSPSSFPLSSNVFKEEERERW